MLVKRFNSYLFLKNSVFFQLTCLSLHARDVFLKNSLIIRALNSFYVYCHLKKYRHSIQETDLWMVISAL